MSLLSPELSISEGCRHSEFLSDTAAIVPVSRNPANMATTRRPQFLELLNDEEYCQLYEYLLRDQNFQLITWDNLHWSGRHMQWTVTALLSHDEYNIKKHRLHHKP